MATTPPVQIAVQTPSTPLHGAKYDSNRLRKRTRYSSTRKQRAIETPPPNSHHDLEDSSSLNPKRASTLRSAGHTYSPPSSTHTSPRKKYSKSRLSRSGNTNHMMNGTNPFPGNPRSDQMQDTNNQPSLQQPSLNTAAGMLPTPAKTPRKKPVNPSAVNGAARVLFPVHQPDSAEDAMPTPRKKRSRRHVGFSLYSSMEDDGDASSEGKIQIYTDSKDKVPEFDSHEDNPFLERPEEHPTPPEPSKTKTSKKRKAHPTEEQRKEVTDTFDREQGMVYVFRGKKVYRKFPDADNEDSNDPGSPRPLTRSSIKPRLLFPTPKQRLEREDPNISDEEATTDIGSLPEAEEVEEVTTPVKQTVFSPATPPTTGHATRSATKKVEDPEPVAFMKGKKVSPFDGWARTKAGSDLGGGGKSRKREGGAVESEGGGQHKRVKGHHGA